MSCSHPLCAAGVLAMVVAGGACREAVPLEGARVYVTSELTGRVTVIDAVTHRVVGGVDTHGRARGIRLDAHGARAYVAVAPSLVPSLGDSMTGRIVVVDTRLLRVLGSMPSATNTQQLAVLPAGPHRVLAPDDERRQVRVWDAGGHAVSGAPATGPEPEAIAVTPDGRFAVVLAEGDDTATLIDVATLQVLRSVTACARPRGIAFSPDGAAAYVSCEGDASIAVLSLPQLERVALVPLGGQARPVGLALGPDGRALYVAAGRARQVLVVDPSSRTVVARIAVGARPWHLALEPGGTRLFVANGPSDDISVIDVVRRAVVATIPVAGRPWGIAVG